VGVSDDQADTRQRRKLLRRALSVASGNQDSGGWIFAMNAADGSTRILIGRCGDGAGIQDDDFSFYGGGGTSQPTAQQLALDGGAIGLGRATSEGLNMICRHQAIILGVL
jgi:hypothetical protein